MISKGEPLRNKQFSSQKNDGISHIFNWIKVSKVPFTWYSALMQKSMRTLPNTSSKPKLTTSALKCPRENTIENDEFIKRVKNGYLIHF